MNRKVLDPLVMMSILAALLFVYKSAELELGEKAILVKELEVAQARIETEVANRQKIILDFANYKHSQELNSMPHGSDRMPASIQSSQLSWSPVLLKRAQVAFGKAEMAVASEALLELFNKYPSAPETAEALLLDAEIKSQQGKIISSLDSLMILIENHPQKLEAGFGLLKVAAIYTDQRRFEEATSVLEILSQNYSQSSVLIQKAKELERKIKNLPQV